jgi:hypothetical protein
MWAGVSPVSPGADGGSRERSRPRRYFRTVVDSLAGAARADPSAEASSAVAAAAEEAAAAAATEAAAATTTATEAEAEAEERGCCQVCGERATIAAMGPCGHWFDFSHLRRDWARQARICAGTGLTPPTSTPGPGLTPPSVPGLGLTPPASAPGLGLTACGRYCVDCLHKWLEANRTYAPAPIPT